MPRLTRTTTFGSSVVRAMRKEQDDKSIFTLYSSFLFKKSFLDFFQKMRVDGIGAARKFWDSYPYKNFFPPNVTDLFEHLINFYADLGLMPKGQYEELLGEQERAEIANSFLRETFTQLVLQLYLESGERMREVWRSAIHRQMETNRKIAENLLGLFSRTMTEAEKPLSTGGKRQELRHKSDLSVEFALSDSEDAALKGVILNFSDSGLCVNSPIPLHKGQKIIIKGSIPTQHQAYTVRWADAFRAGLSV